MTRKKPSKLKVFFYLKIMPRLRKLNYWLIARVALAMLWLLRRLPADQALAFVAGLARRFGPWFGRHRTAVDNLRHAYPEKSESEIEAIALDMWENMARLAAEYIFLDRLYDFDPNRPTAGRVEIAGEEHFLAMAAEPKKPHIIFTAHLGNFELLSVAGAAHGLKLSALFRPPNNPYIADYIHSTRGETMGDMIASDKGAAFALAHVLEAGGNVGMLVDQKYMHGARTTFFGRECETNPVLPMLARRFDCDVYPARCVRLPGNRYRLIVEEKLVLPRNEAGDVDIKATAQLLNDIVERWVREDPGQWMWFHKRWSLTTSKRRRKQVRPA